MEENEVGDLGVCPLCKPHWDGEFQEQSWEAEIGHQKVPRGERASPEASPNTESLCQTPEINDVSSQQTSLIHFCCLNSGYLKQTLNKNTFFVYKTLLSKWFVSRDGIFQAAQASGCWGILWEGTWVDSGLGVVSLSPSETQNPQHPEIPRKITAQGMSLYPKSQFQD